MNPNKFLRHATGTRGTQDYTHGACGCGAEYLPGGGVTSHRCLPAALNLGYHDHCRCTACSTARE